MNQGLNPGDLERLKAFIATCQKKPQFMWLPELKFFRDYIESLGGSLPKPQAEEPFTTESSNNAQPQPDPSKTDDSSTPMEEDVESEESEVELDNDGVIEPETIDPPEMGDQSKEVSEEDDISASEKRSEAQGALGEGNLDKAIELFTDAIKLNPHSAMLYAKRANVLLKQKRVKAALRDCDEALNLNPDSATAHKYRGRAERLLGNWLEAATNLRLACKLDFDEEAHEWLKEVEPNVLKIEEHKRKRERKKYEKEEKARAERVRKAKEDYEKAQKSEKSKPSGMPSGGMPFGGMPGGMPGGGNIGDIFSDPEIMTAMQDPEVAAAFQEISMNPNPETIFKIQSNPKIAPIFEKIMKKFGGGGGMPGGGGFPGGMPGGGGFPGGMPGGGGFPGGFPGGMPGGFPGGMPGGFPGGMPGGFPGGVPPSSPPRDDLD